MTTRTFAAWVEPLAERFGENRRAVLDFARALPPQAWELASPLEGWTYRDILAHLGAGNYKSVQAVLRAVITRTPFDPALFADDNAQNARNVAERRGRSVDELIAELEADKEEIQDLLSQLKAEDEGLSQAGYDVTLGQALPFFAAHDLEHLEHLRSALEG